MLDKEKAFVPTQSAKSQILHLFSELKWEVELEKVINFQNLSGDQFVEFSVHLARVLLGILALKSKVYIHLNKQIAFEVGYVIAQRLQANKEFQASRTQSKSEDVEAVDLQRLQEDSFGFNTNEILPTDADFLVEIAEVSTINSIMVENVFYQIRFSIQIFNKLIHALLTGNNDELEQVHQDLISDNKSETYTIGNIRYKEQHTYIFDSSVGSIQIGIPPETIKTSMKKGEDVPQIYILPPILFAEDVNFGEVEFPIFFNFFIKQAFKKPDNKVVLIGQASHLETVKIVFKESMYGPDADQIYIDEEISAEKKLLGYKIDFLKERSVLAYKSVDGESAPITEFANFVSFDEFGVATFKKFSAALDREVEIKIMNNNGLFRFYEDGTMKGALDTNIYQTLPSKSKKEAQIAESVFEPPTLGITFLGTSHGFDEKGNTTGFIIWINGRGIVVDPPIQTTNYLHSKGIKTSFVDKVILTHCHSDHDSGVIRKIIEGEKIELYTTKTIHESYKRKMNASTGLNIEDYYNFIPVPIGKAFMILGAIFEFDYSFHTIPTLRFRVRYADKTIAYSCDTQYDPKLYSELSAKKILSPEREMSLRMFLFDADVIIHESGVPPIHTSIYNLNELPTPIKKRMLVVHCHHIPDTVVKTLEDGTKITIPVTDLKIPKSGLENTIYLQVGQYTEGFSHAARRFNMLSDVFFFRRITPPTMYNLFSSIQEQFVHAGQEIIKAGEESDSFFLIENGIADVFDVNGTEYKGDGSDSQSFVTTLRRGDAFGENALRSARHMPRGASVVARSDCHLLKINSDIYRKIIQKDELQELRIDYDISKVTRNRAFVAGVLANTYLFQNLQSDQINALASMLEDERKYSKDSYLIREGDHDSSLFLIKEGSVRLERINEEGVSRVILRLGVGQVFGEMSLITGLPRTASVIANEEVVVMELKKQSFERLMSQQQNFKVKMALLVEQRLKENKRISQELKAHSLERRNLFTQRRESFYL